ACRNSDAVGTDRDADNRIASIEAGRIDRNLPSRDGLVSAQQPQVAGDAVVHAAVAIDLLELTAPNENVVGAGQIADGMERVPSSPAIPEIRLPQKMPIGRRKDAQAAAENRYLAAI